jgi:sirohydrochlorin ferrochelatase
MAAPALILLAESFEDERVAQVYHGMRKQMQQNRPTLPVHLVFLGGAAPSGQNVVSTLHTRGIDEFVFVPLNLTRATEPAPEATALVEQLKADFPNAHIVLARAIGPAPELLSLLDLRLRQALGAAGALELDSLVLSVPDSGDTRGNALISRRARQWRNHHHLPVAIAYADHSGPSITQALANLRAQGRRATAVGSLFLTADTDFSAQAEQALFAGAVGVSSPFGTDERILDLIMARYAVAALDLLDEIEPGETPLTVTIDEMSDIYDEDYPLAANL